MIYLLQALKLLSVMAAIRLDEKPDKIESLLFSSLMNSTLTVPSSKDRSVGAATDLLASSTWEEVLRVGSGSALALCSNHQIDSYQGWL